MSLLESLQDAKDRSDMPLSAGIIFRLSMLRLELHRLEEVGASRNVIRYFPVAAYACVEEYFKRAIEELIDHGDPFHQRVDGLLKKGGLKIDSGLLAAISGRRVTIGELVAHSLGYSSIEAIDGHVTTLIGRPFLTALREFCEPPSNYQKAEGDPERPSFDKTMREIHRLTKARHIIAHEATRRVNLTAELVSGWLSAVETLVNCSYHFLSGVQFPEGVPETQADMTSEARLNLRVERARIARVTSQLRSLLSRRLQQRLAAMKRQWDWSLGELASISARALGGGGTMEPQLYYMELRAASEMQREALDALRDRLLSMEGRSEKACFPSPEDVEPRRADIVHMSERGS